MNVYKNIINVQFPPVMILGFDVKKKELNSILLISKLILDRKKNQSDVKTSFDILKKSLILFELYLLDLSWKLGRMSFKLDWLFNAE